MSVHMYELYYELLSSPLLPLRPLNKVVSYPPPKPEDRQDSPQLSLAPITSTNI